MKPGLRELPVAEHELGPGPGPELVAAVAAAFDEQLAPLAVAAQSKTWVIFEEGNYSSDSLVVQKDLCTSVA